MVELEDTRKLLGRLAVNGTNLLVVAGIPAYNEEKTIARVVLGLRTMRTLLLSVTTVHLT